jgi:hypothetical protein
MSYVEWTSVPYSLVPDEDAESVSSACRVVVKISL